MLGVFVVAAVATTSPGQGLTSVQTFNFHLIDPPVPATGGICDGLATVSLDGLPVNLVATPLSTGPNPQLSISNYGASVGSSTLSAGYGVFTQGNAGYAQDEIDVGESIRLTFDQDVLVTSVATQWWDGLGHWTLGYNGYVYNPNRQNSTLLLTDILPAEHLTTIRGTRGLLLTADSIGGRTLVLANAGIAGEEGRWSAVSFAVVVPEPGTLVLAVIGLASLAVGALRCTRRRAAPTTSAA